MITVFNRRELVATFDIGEQSQVKDILAQNKIAYETKTVNRDSPSPLCAGQRAYKGTLGETLKSEYEYIVYVKKKDYELACELIGK